MRVNKTNLNVRVDIDLRNQAENLFAGLGLTMSTAVNMFLQQAVRSQGIPFETHKTPNAEIIAETREAERIVRYTNAAGDIIYFF